MDSSMPNYSSPTSEDLLLCIEKEKEELLKLKKDLESYKAQNQRRRHQRVVDHDWDNALCNLKQVSESKLVAIPSKEVSGKLQFKTSRDTLRDALQNNLKGSIRDSIKGSSLALISNSTASLQKASQFKKTKELQAPPRHIPLDLFNASQFYEGSIDDSDLESSSSPPLQYISLPSQFENSSRNQYSTQDELSSDIDVFGLGVSDSIALRSRISNNNSNFQYRNSIAVDQTSFYNDQGDSFSIQQDVSPSFEREKASSLPCSPDLANYESDFDNDMFEDLSQADDFMSLKGKLEGIEEEEEEISSEQEFEHSVTARPVSRMEFRPSSLLSSNSTLSVPTTISSPTNLQSKTSPLQGIPLDSHILDLHQDKTDLKSAMPSTPLLFDSSETPIISHPLVKTKSVRFKLPISATIESTSADELDEGFDTKQSSVLTTVFSASKSPGTEETFQNFKSEMVTTDSIKMNLNQGSQSDPIDSNLVQSIYSESKELLSSDDQDIAFSEANLDLSIARRVAESSSNRSSVASQVLVSREENFSISRFLADALNEQKAKEAEALFKQEESLQINSKASPKKSNDYFTSNLIISSQYKGRSSLVDVSKEISVPTVLDKKQVISPKIDTLPNLNPLSCDNADLNITNTKGVSSHIIQAGSSSPKLPQISSSEKDELSSEISVALSPLNEYHPSPLNDARPLSSVTINQMVHNAFFNQRDSYTTPKVSPLSFNLEQGDMTVTPRRIKERKTYLLHPEDSTISNQEPFSETSNQTTVSTEISPFQALERTPKLCFGNSDSSLNQTVSPGLSTVVGSPQSKFGLGQSDSNYRKTLDISPPIEYSQTTNTEPKKLRTSFSDSGLREYSEMTSKDIQEVSTLPTSKVSRLGVEMAASLDAGIEQSQSYSEFGSTNFTSKFPFRTIGNQSRRNFGTTSSIRTKLFKFGSSSNLSLVSKFDRGSGSAVTRKDTNTSLEYTPVRRNTILQRLRKIVTRDSSSNDIRRLYQFDDSKLRTLIASGEEISTKLLSSRNAYVLEVNDILFLWFGKQSSDIKQRQASRFAGTLLRNVQQEQSSHQTIRIEFEGSEHVNFTNQFPDWESSSFEPNLTDFVIDQFIGNPHFAEVYNRPWAESLVDLDDYQHVSLKIWLMRSTTDHIELPTTEHGIFFSSEAYVMLYHYRDSHHADHHVVFYWIGRNSKRAREPILPPSKVALDNQNEALMVQVLQGRESDVFMKLFNGLIVVRWGIRKSPSGNQNILKLATEYNSHPGAHSNGDRALYHISGLSATNVKAEQTTCSSRYLCSGHSFLLVAKGKVFVWHGIGSFLFERLAAVMIAKRIAPPGSKIQEVREKLEPRNFWSGFGSERLDYADALQWARKPFLQGQYRVRLFQLSHSIPTGLSVQELRPFHQLDLLPDHAYILDTYFDLFLWCRYDGGPRLFSLTNDPTSPSATLFSCLHLCMEYTRHIDRTEARPFKLKPIMVLPGHEPLEFIAAFSGWEAGDHARSSRFKPPTLKRKTSSRALPVEYLLSKFAPAPQSQPKHSASYSKNSHSLTSSMHVF